MRARAALCAGALALAIPLGLSGEEAPARVLFDEAHHNVHSADGGYRELVALLVGAGHRVAVGRRPFDAEPLAEHDVVLIPAPRGAGRWESLEERSRPAFSEGELERLLDWLESGGGVLLMTDHPPIGVAAGSLLARLGIEGSDAFTADPTDSAAPSGEVGILQGSILVFRRENGSLADHPVTAGRGADGAVSRIVTFLGQSLVGPPGSVPLLRLGEGARDWRLRWSGEHWLPPTPETPATSAAGRAQAVLIELGRGRAAVFGEAGLFTASGLSCGDGVGGEPSCDNGRLALRVVDWLAGSG